MVQASLGEVVPADIVIVSGSLLVDQSMLTGEFIPVEMAAGKTSYAGSLIWRGEAIAKVVATGTRTYFGRTAELVRVAHVESTEQKAVLAVVRNLTAINFVIVVAIVAYALSISVSLQQITLLVLTAMLSAVPVALAATFTLAAALGARTLAQKGVLLTRLSALHEAAAIDVLCCDKTGTLTLNELAVGAILPVKSGCEEADVVGFAALASSAAGDDPIDSVIRKMQRSGKTSGHVPPAAMTFKPFDPELKMAEATAIDHGREIPRLQGRAHGSQRFRANHDRSCRRAGCTRPRRLSNARSRCRTCRFIGTDRLHCLRRSAASEFGRNARGIALARRGSHHGHRRRRRHGGDGCACDWAKRTGLPAGKDPRLRRSR